ncbi:MFS transporter [Novosphingobium bradum]|uniref:MFS transporter n=1 Tax=Novosphingobium bradum TaxID=1737444 RepID=A0ABV7INE3_9SPHN
MSLLTARQEWRAAWPIPFIAMLGLAGTMILPYSSGVLIGPVTKDLGWTRAEFSSGFTFQVAVLLFMAPIVGRAIDRFGPRRVLLTGIVPYAIALSAIGFAADGRVWQWQLLCGIQGVVGSFIAAPPWMTGVVSRFDTSRGLAVAIALAGVSLASLMWPIAAAFALGWLGWRLTFAALVGGWALLLLPLTALLFFAARDLRGDAGAAARETARHEPRIGLKATLKVLRTRAVVLVVTAGCLYLTVSVGLMVHLVPILEGNGIGLKAAAGLAGLAGLGSLVGRITTGFLLDRFSTRVIGLVAFSLPVVASVLLMQGLASVAVSALAAVLYGLAAGAETDLVTYLLSRRVPTAMFGSAYAIVTALFSLCAGVGPLVAGALYDIGGNYQTFLMAVIPVVLTGGVLIWLIPPPPIGHGTPEQEAEWAGATAEAVAAPN